MQKMITFPDGPQNCGSLLGKTMATLARLLSSVTAIDHRQQTVGQQRHDAVTQAKKIRFSADFRPVSPEYYRKELQTPTTHNGLLATNGGLVWTVSPIINIDINMQGKQVLY